MATALARRLSRLKMIERAIEVDAWTQFTPLVGRGDRRGAGEGGGEACEREFVHPVA
ncbi:MAG: hypothetical protein LC720_02940 [Actinobacteria bacterium]|nr:hypothetical protein [Actinomycetota bacterium]